MILALSTSFHDLECWSIKAKIKSRIMAAEMNCMRKSLGYNWTDYKTNTEILNELKIRENTCIQIKLDKQCE